MSSSHLFTNSFPSRGYISMKTVTRYLFASFLLFVFICLSASPAYSRGKAYIWSTPEDARVIIDGKSCGRTPLVIKLEPGTHKLELKKKDFVSYETVIKIKNKKKTKINVVLDREDRYGIVIIKTRPSNARLFLNNEYYELSPLRLKLPEGKYHIRLEKNGYNPLAQKIMVHDGQKYILDFDLEPVELHGTLILETHPRHSRVFIDNTYFDKSPIRVRLLSGKHLIRIKKKGYRIYTEEIRVKSGRRIHRSVTLQKLPPLRPPEGIVRIHSIPEGSRVRINGKKHGKTPFEIRLKAAVYDLELSKKGYKPWQRKIEIRGREIVNIYPQLEKKYLSPRSGILNITTRPKRAKVFIDRKYWGKTPLHSIRLPAGPHVIRLKKRGFRSFEEKRHIRPGKEHNLDFPLVPLQASIQKAPADGILDLVSRPLNTKVFINGKYCGETPLTLKVRPDKYSIELRHKGFRPYYQETDVGPGERVPIRADLTWKGIFGPIQFPGFPF